MNTEWIKEGGSGVQATRIGFYRADAGPYPDGEYGYFVINDGHFYEYNSFGMCLFIRGSEIGFGFGYGYEIFSNSFNVVVSGETLTISNWNNRDTDYNNPNFNGTYTKSLFNSY
jgi:hypothetical protein